MVSKVLCGYGLTRAGNGATSLIGGDTSGRARYHLKKWSLRSCRHGE